MVPWASEQYEPGPKFILVSKQFYEIYRSIVCKQVHRSRGKSKDRHKRVKWILRR